MPAAKLLREDIVWPAPAVVTEIAPVLPLLCAKTALEFKAPMLPFALTVMLPDGPLVLLAITPAFAEKIVFDVKVMSPVVARVALIPALPTGAQPLPGPS